MNNGRSSKKWDMSETGELSIANDMNFEQKLEQKVTCKTAKVVTAIVDQKRFQ